MNKTARTFLTLILSIFVLSGCSSTQAPSQYSDGSNRLGDVDIVPDACVGSDVHAIFDDRGWVYGRRIVHLGVLCALCTAGAGTVIQRSSAAER